MAKLFAVIFATFLALVAVLSTQSEARLLCGKNSYLPNTAATGCKLIKGGRPECIVKGIGKCLPHFCKFCKKCKVIKRHKCKLVFKIVVIKGKKVKVPICKLKKGKCGCKGRKRC